MRHIFKVSERLTDGSVRIPPEKVARWERQMRTGYGELSEAERDSDREQADRVLALLNPGDEERS